MMYLHQSFNMVGVKEDGLLAADLQRLESRPTSPAVLDNIIILIMQQTTTIRSDVLTNEDDLELLKVDLDQRYFINTLRNPDSEYR